MRCSPEMGRPKYVMMQTLGVPPQIAKSCLCLPPFPSITFGSSFVSEGMHRPSSPMPRPQKPCIHRPHGYWCTGPTGTVTVVHVGSPHGFVPDADDTPTYGRNLSILYCCKHRQQAQQLLYCTATTDSICSSRPPFVLCVKSTADQPLFVRGRGFKGVP